MRMPTGRQVNYTYALDGPNYRRIGFDSIQSLLENGVTAKVVQADNQSATWQWTGRLPPGVQDCTSFSAGTIPPIQRVGPEGRTEIMYFDRLGYFDCPEYKRETFVASTLMGRTEWVQVANPPARWNPILYHGAGALVNPLAQWEATTLYEGGPTEKPGHV